MFGFSFCCAGPRRDRRRGIPQLPCWLEILENRGIPAGPVRYIEEMVDHPQVKAAGLLAEVEHQEAGKVKMLGPLAKFNGAFPPPVSASPALGQHTEEILLELGFSPEEVSRWRRDGIVL